MHTVGSSSRRSPPREKSSPRWPSAKPSTPRTSRPARQSPLLETPSRPRLTTWRTYRATTWWPRSTTRSCSSASGTARIRRGIRESSAEPDEDEEFLEDPVRESPDEPAVIRERGHVQLSEDRRDDRPPLIREQVGKGDPEHGRHLGPSGRFEAGRRQRHVGDDEYLRLVAGRPRRHVPHDLGATLEIDADFLFRLAERGREHRRVLAPMPSSRKAHLPGPRVAFAFRPLAQEDLEAVWAVVQDDHHRGGGFRLQFRFGELEGQQELPQAFEGGFGHPEAAYDLPEYNGIHPRNNRPGVRESSFVSAAFTPGS